MTRGHEHWQRVFEEKSLTRLGSTYLETRPEEIKEGSGIHLQYLIVEHGDEGCLPAGTYAKVNVNSLTYKNYPDLQNMIYGHILNSLIDRKSPSIQNLVNVANCINFPGMYELEDGGILLQFEPMLPSSVARDLRHNLHR